MGYEYISSKIHNLYRILFCIILSCYSESSNTSPSFLIVKLNHFIFQEFYYICKLYLQLGCPMTNFGLLLRWQPHSPDIYHYILLCNFWPKSHWGLITWLSSYTWPSAQWNLKMQPFKSNKPGENHS